MVLVTSALVAVLAWLFGLPEAAVVSAAGLAVVVAAAVQVWFNRPDLTVHRTARPQRVEVGQPCEIQMETLNAASRRSPVVSLVDDVGRFGKARLTLAPLAAAERSTAVYSLPTHQRGVHRVGPLTMTAEDPFGLLRHRTESSSTIAVIVLPMTWALTPLPPAQGDEPELGTRSLTSTSTVDEEFATLREYVAGDDIRRIHWPSTARMGTPVVRQFEVPWQRRTTVLLDQRAAAHDDDSFERAVSAAASVIELAATRGELIRYVTTTNQDSGFVPAADHVEDLMDQLAVVTPDPASGPTALLGTLAQVTPTNVGRLVTCLGRLGSTEAAEVERLTRTVDVHVSVLTASGAGATGPTVVHFDGGQRLDDLWEAAIAGRAAREAARW